MLHSSFQFFKTQQWEQADFLSKQSAVKPSADSNALERRSAYKIIFSMGDTGVSGKSPNDQYWRALSKIYSKHQGTKEKVQLVRKGKSQRSGLLKAID